MSDLRVPAVLFPAILAFATQDLIDAAVAADDDDVMALAVGVAAISSDRIADYVASVVGRGFAEPAGEGGPR